MKKILTSLLILTTAMSFAQTGSNKNETKDSVSYSVSLSEVRVSAPSKTRMKDGGMVTRVVASALSNLGNAEDVLSRIPGMMVQQGELQVIGKGAPTYYVNGRKVHDLTILRNISSRDIKDVEVISTPGAEYDAQTHAVVKIRTLRQKGEGYGMNLMTKNEVAPSCGNTQSGTTVSMNYRHNALDLFGGASFSANHLKRYATTVTQESFTTANNQLKHFKQDCSTTLSQRNNTQKYNLGFNYQPTDDHSFGIRVERTDNLKSVSDFSMPAIISNNGIETDHLLSETRTDADGVNSWLANGYYNGTIGKMSIDLDVDYYKTNDKNTATTDEKSWNEVRQVVSSSNASNQLFATKLIVSYPLWEGKFKAGTELTFVKRHSLYTITDNAIQDDKSDVTDNNYAVFAEYSRMIPHVGMINLGMRYEHTAFSYDNRHDASLSQHRDMDNIYPFASIGTRIGKVSASLSYSVRTRRPSYSMLRSNIEYNNRFTLSTGDPKLKNELRHELGLSAQWRWLAGTINYQRHERGIYDWTSPYGNEDDGTLMISWVNFSKPLNRISAFINASPTIGCWSPSYTIGIQKQWISFNLSDPRTKTGTRRVSYNRPMIIFDADNVFRFAPRDGNMNKAWQIELCSSFTSSANYGNAELKNCFWNLKCAIQKSFLKDGSLSVRLAADDVFHTAYYRISLDLGNYIFSQSPIYGQKRDLYDLQRLSLSVNYKFNVTKSKYKGTGAGNEMRSRM